MKVVFVVLIALMIIITSAFLFFFIRGSDEAEPSPEPPVEAEVSDAENPDVTETPDVEEIMEENESLLQEENQADDIELFGPSGELDISRMRRHAVPVHEIDIDGLSGFVIYLDESYTLESWEPEFGDYRVFDEMGFWLMMISQKPNIGKTPEEWVIEHALEFGTEEVPYKYSRPTAEFPYYAFEEYVASGEGNIMREFVRDNGKGGVFFISILLFPSQWEQGHGPSLLYSISFMEVLEG